MPVTLTGKLRLSHCVARTLPATSLKLTLVPLFQLSWMMMTTRVSLILLGKMLFGTRGGPLV